MFSRAAGAPYYAVAAAAAGAGLYATAALPQTLKAGLVFYLYSLDSLVNTDNVLNWYLASRSEHWETLVV